MGMWLDMPGLCRQSRVNWPIECDDSNRALRYSTVRETSDPDVQNTPTGHRGHLVWHDMGDLERCLVKITSDWYCWNEHDTTQCSRHQSLLQSKNYIGLITLQKKHCTLMSRKDCLEHLLWDHVCMHAWKPYGLTSEVFSSIMSLWLWLESCYCSVLVFVTVHSLRPAVSNR